MSRPTPRHHRAGASLRGWWRARAGADGGFTLIESVVSLGLFVVASVAAVFATITAISGTNANRDRVAATNVAQQEIANDQAMPRASLTASPTAVNTATVGGEQYTVTRSVGYLPANVSCPTAPDTQAAHQITVQVTVTWPGANGRSVQVGSVLAC